MKFKHVISSFIFLFAFGLILSAQPQQKPLIKDQVVNLVENQFGDKSGARAIKQRGIDFEPRADFLGEVSRGGGDAELLQALRAAKVTKAKAVDTATAAEQVEVRKHLARAAALIHQDKVEEAEQEYRAALVLSPRCRAFQLSFLAGCVA